jgi:hypothetical protein
MVANDYPKTGKLDGKERQRGGDAQEEGHES